MRDIAKCGCLTETHTLRDGEMKHITEKINDKDETKPATTTKSTATTITTTMQQKRQ